MAAVILLTLIGSFIYIKTTQGASFSSGEEAACAEVRKKFDKGGNFEARQVSGPEGNLLAREYTFVVSAKNGAGKFYQVIMRKAFLIFWSPVYAGQLESVFSEKDLRDFAAINNWNLPQPSSPTPAPSASPAK
jgi:hypothetical protein